MNREFSAFDAVGVPDDWKGQIDMIDSENITRSTLREGAVNPSQNMPPFAPPFDSQITRTFNRGKALFVHEIEQSYEARQVGSIAPVKSNGQLLPHFLFDSYLAIPTHSSPQWVLVNHYTDYYEQYNDDGECIVSAKSDYSDDGAKWLFEHALSSTGDDNLDELQEAYAKFSQQSNGLLANFGQSSVSDNQWHFIELQGRTKSYTQKSEALQNLDEWYDNGQYFHSERCPHYKNYACSVFALADPDSGQGCYRNKGSFAWSHCNRAIEALNLARQNDATLVNPVIYGSASSKAKKFIGYQRDVYIDKVISDQAAQSIADNIASNILAVKGRKGIRKTVTIPYNPSYLPNGYIIEVSHDWENLTSSVIYLDNTDDLPDFLISQSVSGIAAFVAARENSRHNSSAYGKVTAVRDNSYSVNVAGNIFTCSSKLKNIDLDDVVLVAFPAGNKISGVIIARL